MSQPRSSGYYHRRADEMRLAAIEAHSSDNRDTLRSFAVYFDRLGDEAERAEQVQYGKGGRLLKRGRGTAPGGKAVNRR